MELKERMIKFVTELGIPTTAFARNVGISTSTIREWKKGTLVLSKKTSNRISEYLTKYGF